MRGYGGDPGKPLSFVSIIDSVPTPGGRTPAGWSLTFRNDGAETHVLGWKVYVSCLEHGS